MRAPVGLAPVIVFLLASRLLVFLSARFGMRHVLQDPTAPIGPLEMPAWFRWDAAYYLTIAKEGYPSQEVYAAFFPLYPLLGAVIGWATGLPTPIALIVVSNICFFAAGLLLFDLARREFDVETGLIAVMSLSFFPSTMFLSAPYTESLFILLCVLTFRLLRTGDLWLAAAVAGLAAAARPFGCVLAISVAVEAYLRARDAGRPPWTRSLAMALVSAWGLLAYVAYLVAAFGDPWRFIRAHLIWHVHPVDALWAYLPWRLADAIVRSESREAMINGVFFLGLVCITVATWDRVPLRYSLLSISVAVILYWRAPYILLIGTERYVVSLVPLHLSLALLLRRRLDFAIAFAALFAGVSVFWTSLYVQGYPIR